MYAFEYYRPQSLSGAVADLEKLAGGTGDPHVRNMGTTSGSLANNDPLAGVA